ncbi:uroporphyrinogen-III synthase [Cereibacter sphaeroides]|uniref:uroporphyrinogen-III synthase n=1 Tax=Cereibacter sphaeroides TaxID=1063 RepID=UPI00076F7CC3|nr:uroporphyrinogen-III synthase [Cereibacter sphaeroides]AMJ46055.1 uroporphyrinogen-III synthase [Cereibacter sphaeroides]ANS32766.1 uroporphyrinogen-III synthase [Cereibacter sphaeroides]ATN61819.1 uroporphyrinogen-III synthase [Cereibacter sphaeroides]QHA12312.1 uroporphyrinogen-III synthase [Cereibacter sphaeroides]
MVPQSRPLVPAVLLTRPEAQGARFAAALAEALGPVRLVTSPLMVPAFLVPAIPLRPDALIFTSETGVEGYRRLAAPELSDVRRAWCVGNRTARAAEAAGLAAHSAEGDAERLIAAILAADEPGPLLHLRGAESRGEVAPRLAAAGLTAAEAVVYDQRPQPLSSEARALLTDGAPVIAPLFSPRTARLLAQELARIGGTGPPWVAAMSPAVAEAAAALPVARLSVAARPDAEALLQAVKALLDAEADA